MSAPRGRAVRGWSPQQPAQQQFLSEDESVAVVREFQRRHPWRTRLFAAILGWGDLSSETAVREFVRSRPFVSFRPAKPAPS
jgi:hypothetical protein